MSAQHHFAQQGLPPPAARLDYQTPRDALLNRPLSNPRSSTVFTPKDPSVGHSRSHSTQGSRYPGHFPPTTYAELDAERAHAQQQSGWPPKHAGSGLYQFDEGRRVGGGGAGGAGAGIGLADSLDLVAEHHPRRAIDEAKLGDANGAAKARLTLDDHMATTRSPKAAAAAHKIGGTAGSGSDLLLGRVSPASFNIPPFGGHPHPPTLPSSVNTPSGLQKSVFPSAGATSGPGGGGHFGHVASAAQRAGG